ncbi:putative leader peptide [Pseudonocardia lacus]
MHPPACVALHSVALHTVALHTVWHAWRRHVDLCRTSTALCPG